MPFFNELKRTREPSFFFFPGIYAPGLRHFLEAEKITGCEIVKKQDVLPHLPHDFKVPEDIRLSPNAPRIEKRVSCLASYYDIATVQAAYHKQLTGLIGTTTTPAPQWPARSTTTLWPPTRRPCRRSNSSNNSNNF